MTTLDRAAYGDNPALKIPVLIDAQGPLFGTENICRALMHRARVTDVVLRGDVATRVVANAEELSLHALSAGVTLITSAAAQQPPPPKVRPSLDNALAFLEAHIDEVLAALPASRRLSFCETSLFCLLTHLPFRNVMEVTPYPRLQAFCTTFAHRPSAASTTYRYDTP
jgi:glutathione S-transferase